MRVRGAAGVVLAFGLVLLCADARAQKKSIDTCVANFEEAQLKEKRGKLVAARELYAACADPKCPALVRKDCTAKRDEIDRTVPTITIVIRDAGGKDVSDATLVIDGTPFDQDRARAFAVDPGQHVITYTLRGKAPAEEKITIYEGEKARVVAITAKADSTPAPPPAEPKSEKPVAPVVTADAGGRSLLMPLIVGGVGIVLVATAIGLEITAQNDENAAQGYAAKANDPVQSPDEQAANAFRAAASSRHDAAKHDQLYAIIAGSAGAIAIGVAVVLYVTQHPKKTTALAPWVTASSGGAMLGGVF